MNIGFVASNRLLDPFYRNNKLEQNPFKVIQTNYHARNWKFIQCADKLQFSAFTEWKTSIRPIVDGRRKFQHEQTFTGHEPTIIERRLSNSETNNDDITWEFISKKELSTF